MTRLLAAFAFLTRIPIRRAFRRAFSAEDVGRASVFFPVVGVAVGGIQLFVYTYTPVPALVKAVLVVGVAAWLTRGLHLDGLADFADGLGGGPTRERALEIMKDPRVGAFGATALVLLVAFKVAAVRDLREPVMLLAAPVLARWALLPLGRLPYARGSESGTGQALSQHAGRFELVVGTVLASGLFWFAPPKMLLWAIGGVLATSVVVASIAWSRLGGVTGDVLGANVEITEAVVLVVGTMAMAA